MNQTSKSTEVLRKKSALGAYAASPSPASGLPPFVGSPRLASLPASRSSTGIARTNAPVSGAGRSFQSPRAAAPDAAPPAPSQSPFNNGPSSPPINAGHSSRSRSAGSPRLTTQVADRVQPRTSAAGRGSAGEYRAADTILAAFQPAWRVAEGGYHTETPQRGRRPWLLTHAGIE
ncbi:uncharacterized protein LOC124552253 [Schistocerca americana]|uniref:uncharacterized protein LOC124552253 n=1 Tax=Schistocerca americana TaxID=7009 RepID=UPI001F4FF17F|nr:uncharacterized protein LOC124552253 [Schistocerca americana]